MTRFLFSLMLFAGVLAGRAQDATYLQAITAHREAYGAGLLQMVRSPLRTPEAVARLRFYAPDTTYRFKANFVRTPHAEPVEMPTTDGKTKPFVAYGRVTFRLAGATHTLTLYRNLELSRLPIYRDYLFLPFRDTTNGKTTYGGGRYLDIRAGTIQNGIVELDFNKAYNPYCAYDESFACPIPPRENWLRVPISAGEKTYNTAER